MNLAGKSVAFKLLASPSPRQSNLCFSWCSLWLATIQCDSLEPPSVRQVMSMDGTRLLIILFSPPGFRHIVPSQSPAPARWLIEPCYICCHGHGRSHPNNARLIMATIQGCPRVSQQQLGRYPPPLGPSPAAGADRATGRAIWADSNFSEWDPMADLACQLVTGLRSAKWQRAFAQMWKGTN